MVNEIKNVDGVDFALSFSDISKLGISEDMLSDKMLKVFKSDNYQMVLVNSLYEVASDEINEQIGEIQADMKRSMISTAQMQMTCITDCWQKEQGISRKIRRE